MTSQDTTIDRPPIYDLIPHVLVLGEGDTIAEALEEVGWADVPDEVRMRYIVTEDDLVFMPGSVIPPSHYAETKAADPDVAEKVRAHVRPLSPVEEGRVASIPISADVLYHLVDLPFGYRIERLWMRQDPMVVHLLVSSADLAPQAPDAESPRLGGAWHTIGVEVDGKVWRRWAWSPEGKRPDDVMVDTSIEHAAGILLAKLYLLCDEEGPHNGTHLQTAAAELADAIRDGVARLGRAGTADELTKAAG